MKLLSPSVQLLAATIFVWSNEAAAENTITIRPSRELQGGTLGGSRETDVDINPDFQNIPSLTLEGTNGGETVVYLKKTPGGSADGTIWHGEIEEGDQIGDATILQDDQGGVAASFSDNNGIYQMNTLPDGSVVTEFVSYDDLQDDVGEEFEEERHEAERHFEAQGQTLGGSERMLSSVRKQLRGAFKVNENDPEDFSPLVDEDQVRKLGDDREVHVLVLYSWDAMCGESGGSCEKGPIERRIKLAEEETNGAYKASGMKTTIKVVHTVLLDNDFDELGGDFRKMLSALGRAKEGLEDVPQMRNDYGADLVTLIANKGGYCGYGNIRGPYSVTKRNCMTGYYSFGHEIAHNFGCFHNRGSSNRQHEFAHGYQDESGDFRSVMAYDCPTRRCPRVPMYSNPNKKYRGKKIGDRDNNCARQIDDFSITAAGWKDPSTSTSTPAPTPPPTPAPTPAPTTCTDFPNWHDADGHLYNCAWYASRSIYCGLYGHRFRGVGDLVANEACCVCKV